MTRNGINRGNWVTERPIGEMRHIVVRFRAHFALAFGAFVSSSERQVKIKYEEMKVNTVKTTVNTVLRRGMALHARPGPACRESYTGRSNHSVDGNVIYIYILFKEHRFVIQIG